LRQYAHYLERATLDYFKGDFFSTVVTLLPAADGVIRKYAGWRLNGPRIRYKELPARIMQRPIRQSGRHASRTTMFRYFLLRFLGEWFLIETKDANFAFSFLNRHIGAHAGSKQREFLSDCNQIFALWDVLTEALTYDSERIQYGEIPGEPEILSRAGYYRYLMSETHRSRFDYALENGFLSQHPNYEVEAAPNWLQIQIEVEEELKAVLASIRETRQEPEKKLGGESS
jgi:hypothetical protein